MNSRTHRARPMAAALVALTAAVAALAACTNYDPRFPPPTLSASAAASPASSAAQATSASTAPAASVIASTHVVLTNATAKVVTIDVRDESGTLTAAASGTPGDGASVEAYKLVVKNLSPTSIRLTWLGGPCDSANSLSIDSARHQLLLVQPECTGDSIATDRVLDLSFSSAVKAADFTTSLQDGLDS